MSTPPKGKLKSKTCTKCGSHKLLDEFAKTSSKRKDGRKVAGYANTCKACKSKADSKRISDRSNYKASDITVQVLRARMFLRLIYGGLEEEAAIARLNEIYPSPRPEWFNRGD